MRKREKLKVNETAPVGTVGKLKKKSSVIGLALVFLLSFFVCRKDSRVLSIVLLTLSVIRTIERPKSAEMMAMMGGKTEEGCEIYRKAEEKHEC
jgi:hypothetical protein